MGQKSDEKNNKKFFVYILECADKTFYTGYTNDPDKRIEAHNAGKGAKYTKARLPVKQVYLEVFDDKESALKREWFIKHKLTRKDKIKLIEDQKKNLESKSKKK